MQEQIGNTFPWNIGLRNAKRNFGRQEPPHIVENTIYKMRCEASILYEQVAKRIANIIDNELLVRGYNVDVFVKNSEGKRDHIMLACVRIGSFVLC